MARTIALLLACVALACSEPAAKNTRIVSGRILEVLDSPPYRYMRLETKQGEQWAAVPMAAAPGTGKVEITNGVTVRNLDLKSLNRHFDVVVFGILSR